MPKDRKHGGKREGAGRKASGKVGKSYYLTLSPEATERLNAQGRDKSEYIERLILEDIKKISHMKNQISKREALIFICEVFVDYAKEYADYDDAYGLCEAIKAIDNSAGEYITAEDVRGVATPYTDALWEHLTGADNRRG